MTRPIQCEKFEYKRHVSAGDKPETVFERPLVGVVRTSQHSHHHTRMPQPSPLLRLRPTSPKSTAAAL